MTSVLVVSTADICRSPLAERLLAEYFRRQAPDLEIEVSSAGTLARPGLEAADRMLRIARRWGLDLSSHRSRRVDSDVVRTATLVLTMEDEHRSVVSRLAAGVGQRTFTMTELDEIVAADGPEAPGTSNRGGDEETAEAWRHDETAPMRAVRPVPSGPLASHVARWHAARSRLRSDVEDVVDPHGGSDEDYVRCAKQLAGLVERLGPALAEAARVPSPSGGD